MVYVQGPTCRKFPIITLAVFLVGDRLLLWERLLTCLQKSFKFYSAPTWCIGNTTQMKRKVDAKGSVTPVRSASTAQPVCGPHVYLPRRYPARTHEQEVRQSRVYCILFLLQSGLVFFPPEVHSIADDAARNDIQNRLIDAHRFTRLFFWGAGIHEVCPGVLQFPALSHKGPQTILIARFLRCLIRCSSGCRERLLHTGSSPVARIRACPSRRFSCVRRNFIRQRSGQ